MRPDARFTKLNKPFWASVRSISQELGYTERGEGRIKVPGTAQMRNAFVKLGLSPEAICTVSGVPTTLAASLHAYFNHRARSLETIAARKLMTVEQAKALFDDQRQRLLPRRPVPMNKQKGPKKAPAYLTGLVNMLIEHHAAGAECDYDLRKLATITRNGIPLRTLARRVDGAFPGPVNPVAVWEIKEYYYTTTFGSRVADGVYETLLDGMELEELRAAAGVDIRHYLIVDDYNTWWNMGRSYLCRIVDMLHMGYVDEVLFGAEVLDEIPRLVAEWRSLAAIRSPRGDADPAGTAE